MMNIKINLLHIVDAFTSAMETVDTELVRHQSRVANIAMNLGFAMRLSKDDLFDLLIAAKLHDIGAMSISDKRMISTLNFDYNSPHAIIGYKILGSFKIFEKISEIVLHHHRKWKNGANKFDNNGKEIHMESWIIHFADRIDIAMDHSKFCLSQKDEVIAKLSKHYNTIFHPEVVKAFMLLSDRESFWLDITNSRAEHKYRRLLEKTRPLLQGKSVIELGEAFAQIIDYRSAFTATHSAGVSTVAATITKMLGYDKDTQEKVRFAGNLHDLGKIAIPTEILEKNGKLSDEERLIINTHTYHTFKILDQIDGLEEVNRWASLHHEKLDGSGYPFHLGGESLDIFSKIMIAADLFTALTEDRPYRKAMTRNEVEEVIGEMQRNKTDKVVMNIMLSHYDTINEARIIAQEKARDKYVKIINSENYVS